MIQFEELIMEESMKICEDLSSYAIKEDARTTYSGMTPTKDGIDFRTNTHREKLTDTIRVILLIITALLFNLLFILEGLYQVF